MESERDKHSTEAFTVLLAAMDWQAATLRATRQDFELSLWDACSEFRLKMARDARARRGEVSRGK